MTWLHNTVLAATIVIALSLNGFAQTTTTPEATQTTQPAGQAETASKPATRKSADCPEVQAAKKAVAKAVAALIKDISSDNFARREAAQGALANLSESVLAEVVAQSKLTDAEHIARAGELFSTLIASARQGQMLLALPSGQRKLVAAFAREEPRLFNMAFDENAETAARAMPQLAESNHPAASILLGWAIRSRAWEVRQAALKVASDVDNPHPALADAVYAHMLKTMPKPDVPTETMATTRDRIENEEHFASVVALVAMKNGRVLPRLLDALMNNEILSSPDGTDVNVVDMIRQLKDKRTVVTLMDLVKDNTEVTNMSYEKDKKSIKVTVLKGDVALMMILLQTGQKLPDYGFFIPPDLDEDGYNLQLGFEKSAARKEARKKIRAWWDANKKDYAGVEKVHFGKEADMKERQDLAPFIGEMK